jgi:hypothetical protein
MGHLPVVVFCTLHRYSVMERKKLPTSSKQFTICLRFDGIQLSLRICNKFPYTSFSITSLHLCLRCLELPTDGICCTPNAFLENFAQLLIMQKHPSHQRLQLQSAYVTTSLTANNRSQNTYHRTDSLQHISRSV